MLRRILSDVLNNERSRRVALGVFSGIAGRMAALSAPLFATPILYKYFGDLNFGVWVTAISITSIGTSLDLGIGSGLLTRTATAFGKGDFAAARQYMASAYSVLVAVAGGLIALAFLGFYFHERSGAAFDPQSSRLIVAVTVTFLIGLPAALIHQILYAVQRVPLSSALLVIGAFGGLLGCAVAVRLHAPLWAVATAYSLPSTIAALGGAIFYFGRHAMIRPRISDFCWHRVRDLLGLGSHFLMLSVLMAVGLNADNMIIALKGGPEAVSAFAIPARLGSVLGLVVINLFLPMWGANSEAISRGEHAWVKRGALRMAILGVSIVAVSGLFLLVAGDWIISLWVGRSFKDQHLTLACVVASAAVVAATSPYNMILNALGRADLQLTPWILFGAISISAKLWFVTADTIWLTAGLTGLVYLLVVTPTIIVFARSALARSAEHARTP